MAPEMVLRRPHSFGCDVWSLGVTAVWLLQNSPPFPCQFDALFVPAATGRAPALALPEMHAASASEFVAAACCVDAASRPTAQQLLAHPFVASAVSAEDMWRLVKSIFRHSAINNVIGAF
jgi:serine/threonine protein kinase